MQLFAIGKFCVDCKNGNFFTFIQLFHTHSVRNKSWVVVSRMTATTCLLSLPYSISFYTVPFILHVQLLLIMWKIRRRTYSGNYKKFPKSYHWKSRKYIKKSNVLLSKLGQEWIWGQKKQGKKLSTNEINVLKRSTAKVKLKSLI